MPWSIALTARLGRDRLASTAGPAQGRPAHATRSGRPAQARPYRPRRRGRVGSAARPPAVLADRVRQHGEHLTAGQPEPAHREAQHPLRPPAVAGRRLRASRRFRPGAMAAGLAPAQREAEDAVLLFLVAPHALRLYAAGPGHQGRSSRRVGPAAIPIFDDFFGIRLLDHENTVSYSRKLAPTAIWCGSWRPRRRRGAVRAPVTATSEAQRSPPPGLRHRPRKGAGTCVFRGI
jgi:hypothetical protein